jgi:hypothetical protein
VSKPQELVRNLNHLDSQENYDRLLLEIAHSLVDEWGPRNDLGAPTRMNIGIALKITNLIMKHLSFSRNTSNPQLIQWLHVLWDKFTLKPLRNIWHFTPAMPAEPSQGFVSTLGIYNNLHGIINEISNNAGCPRIYFELFFWNRSHSL